MIQKGSYNIRCTDGIKSVDGYIYTTSVQDEPMSFVITQYNDGWYIITELSTGMELPIQTNINLSEAVMMLKVFIGRRAMRLKTAANSMVKKYGKVN